MHGMRQAQRRCAARQVCSDSAIRTSRHSPAELTNREAAELGAMVVRTHMMCGGGGRSCSGSCAHGIHLAKVANTRRHNTPFDSCRYRNGSRSSACVHQSQPRCGMAMQPHIRRHLLSIDRRDCTPRCLLGPVVVLVENHFRPRKGVTLARGGCVNCAHCKRAVTSAAPAAMRPPRRKGSELFA